MTGFADLLKQAFSGVPLSRDAAREALDMIITDEANDAQTAAFVGALQARGVTVDEMTGLAEAMRAHAIPVPCDRDPLIDTCGTGGDGLTTVNISTAAALVLAGAGVAVAKHGNRAVSSQCGSADVLDALGVAVDDDAPTVAGSIEQHGFGFCFAPRFHPGLARVAGVRRALGVRTVFNLLGPLVNPSRVRRQVVGIFDGARLVDYARVLLALGAERALVVHGADGMDELTLTGPTHICVADARDGVRVVTVLPEEAGLSRAPLAALAGGDAAANAAVIEAVLAGEPGPVADAVVYNASAGLLIADRAATLRDGVAMARNVIADGRAASVLDALRSRRLASQEVGV